MVKTCSIFTGFGYPCLFNRLSLRKKTKLEQKQVLSASKWKKKEEKTIVSLWFEVGMSYVGFCLSFSRKKSWRKERRCFWFKDQTFFCWNKNFPIHRAFFSIGSNKKLKNFNETTFLASWRHFCQVSLPLSFTFLSF